MKRAFVLLVLLGTILTIGACFRRAQDPDALRGTLLIWHTWPEPYGEILNSFIESFMEVNSDVTVVSEHVDADRLQMRFLDQTAAGLGPDLILGVTPEVASQLIEQELLINLAEYMVESEEFQLHGVDAMRLAEELYAVPLAASTQVLFYNTRLADKVPVTLDEIIAAARREQIVGLPADFYYSYWGVNGYAGELVFSATSIEITQGVVEWLSWLQLAQKEPNIIISNDEEELYELFAEGYAAFFVGDSTLLPQFRARLGEEGVGVALLPTSPDQVAEVEEEPGAGLEEIYTVLNPPGAFLELQVGVVSHVSTQAPLALALLRFITNPVQQRQLAVGELGYAPLNRRVRYDYRLPEAETVIVQQSNAASIVPLDYVPLFGRLETIANEAYTQVLGGVLEPAEGAAYIRRELHRIEEEENNAGT